MSFTDILMKSHALIGMLALPVFWAAALSRKGGPLHLFCGKTFIWCAYLAAASGMARCVHVLIDPWAAMQPPGGADDQTRQALAMNVRTIYIFLAYLAVITVAMAWHGVQVIRTRREPQRMKTALNVALNVLSVLLGVAMIPLGLLTGKLLLAFMSPIGIGVGCGQLRYILARTHPHMEWWFEHLGSMVGCGISMHTAFLVFGLNRIISIPLQGTWTIIPWLAPTLAGMPAIYLWSRYYRKKFEQPSPETALFS
ncbi:MAG TPA: hypothetical protein VEK08_18005 [Planctomycetota bacterium]|nr:hypothetical protein [Planctomycetota bacterium]